MHRCWLPTGIACAAAMSMRPVSCRVMAVRPSRVSRLCSHSIVAAGATGCTACSPGSYSSSAGVLGCMGCCIGLVGRWSARNRETGPYRINKRDLDSQTRVQRSAKWSHVRVGRCNRSVLLRAVCAYSGYLHQFVEFAHIHTVA